MVSTTLTTVSAGNTTSSINNLRSPVASSETLPDTFTAIETSNRSHCQSRSSSSLPLALQQHVPSSLTSPTDTTTKHSNFYYSRAYSSERKAAIKYNDNHNDSSDRNHNVNYYQGESQQQLQGAQHFLREQQQLPKTYFNGKTTNGNTATLENFSTPTKTTTTTLVTLSQNLVSSSPPIKDQISLLFPKCRPKTANYNPNTESSPTEDNSNVTGEDHSFSLNSTSNSELKHKHLNIEIEIEDTKEQQLQQQHQQVRNTNNQYYKSVNIITQSPPPHSASSISSESVSSVTPRISTNPFLCSTLITTELREETTKEDFEKLTQQQHNFDENQEQVVEEELPVPNYTSFYYHTSTSSLPVEDLHKHNEDLRKRTIITSTLKQLQRKQHEELRSNTIYEMPRKRSQYERYHHLQSLNAQNNGMEEKSYNQLNHAEIFNSIQQHQHNVDQHQQRHHAQQNGHPLSNQNPFVKDNYWEARQNVTCTSTVLNSPEYSTTKGSIDNESRSHNRRAVCQTQLQVDKHLQHSTGPQQEQTHQQSAFIGRQQPPVPSQHMRLGRSPNTDVSYQDSTINTATSASNAAIQKRNSYNSQHQNSLQKSHAYTDGLTPLAAQYLYGSKTSLHETSQNHHNDWPENIDVTHAPDRAERCLARERELREQRSKAINAERERYLNSALVKESVSEQSACNSLEMRDRLDHERHTYSSQQPQYQQQHHHVIQKHHQQPKSGHYQHHQQNSYKHQQPTHPQRQLNDERLNSNQLVFDDITESWQNLRVTTELSSQINNVHPLVSEAKSLVDTSSPSSVVNSGSKKVHMLSDFKDDKNTVNIDSNCDDNTSPLKNHQEKCLTNTQMINIETRHGIIEYEGSPRRIGQMVNTNDEDHIRRVNNKLSQHLMATSAATSVIAAKGNHHNAIVVSTTASSTTTTNADAISPKQQHFAARPGFPQRIISPQPESAPPILMLNYNSKQHLNSQTLPQQSPTDNNAEDTSNDVSEIGTISDLTTQETISTSNNLLLAHNRASAAIIVGIRRSDSNERPTISPLNNRETEDVHVEQETTTVTSSLTNSCTNPTTTGSLTAIVTTPAINTSGSTPTADAPLNITNASVVAAATLLNSSIPLSIPTKSSTFDYLYEFSETRKVLEEFFKCPSNDDKPIIENSSDVDSIDIQYEFHTNLGHGVGEGEEEEVAAEIEGNEDDIQLDGENVEDEEEDGANNNDKTPQHNQYSQLHQQQYLHLQQEQDNTSPQTDNYNNQHHSYEQNNHYQHHVNYRNHLQSPTQFSYRPCNDDIDGDGDGEDGIDDIDINHDSSASKQHEESKHNIQQDCDGEIGSIVDFDEHNHHNFSLINNRHNSRHRNARRHFTGSPLMRDFDFFLDSVSRSSCEQIDQQVDGMNHNQINSSSRQNCRYSPETTDYDSNCGDLDSLSGELNPAISTSCSNYAAKFYAASAMPVLEDGLSSGHTSDTENNNQKNLLNQQTSTIQHTPMEGGISMLMGIKHVSTNNSINSVKNARVEMPVEKVTTNNIKHDATTHLRKTTSSANGSLEDSVSPQSEIRDSRERELIGQSPQSAMSNNKVFKNIDPDLDSLYSINVFHHNDVVQMTPPPPAPAPHRKPNVLSAEPDILQPTPYRDMTCTGTNNSNSPTKCNITTTVTSTGNSNYSGLQTNTSPKQAQIVKRTAQTQPPPLPERNVQRSPSPVMNSPVWLSRHLDVNASNKGLLESSSENHSKNLSADEDDVDTDLETDRLLGHQRLDDQGYYDENKSWDRKPARSLLSKISPKQVPSTKTRNGYNALLSSTPEVPPPIPPKNSSNKLLDIGVSLSSSEHSDKSPIKSIDIQDCGLNLGSPGGSADSSCLKKDVDNVVGLNSGNSSTASGNGVNSANCNTGGNGSSIGSGTGSATGEKKVKKSKNKEGGAVLIEGVLFRAKYLGSTQLVCEGQPTKSTRMMQAEEAVSRIKAPDGDVQPSTEVDLFISTEKIMVLNTDLKEIMMDHALRTISYIADIGDLVVLMARRRFVPQDIDDAPKPNRTPKMICHVFESDEAQFIAQSIGQAFQVAYMEFLKANGIEDHRFVKEMDYQEVLNSQEIFGDELEIFAKKELQKEVVVPKAKGEILGVVIVESGWGSMLPTVVIANLMSSGAAARCGQLNIGDQLIAINGLSLVGLPLSTCQNYIKNTKNQTVVKFTVVPCPPVVEVKIKRPETKYQLGFSVQNGVICSLLRGGIAERGGVRVGHRIIEINNQSVVAVPHEKIVNLLATSVGEILMKTMPTSMFRLLTGQENPIYI